MVLKSTGRSGLLHWFGGHKISQQFSSKLTDKNYTEFKNTFTDYVSKL